MIYLDNAATTELYPAVFQEMLPWLRAHYANPGALYASGRRAREAVELARHRVAEFLSCESEQVIFTSGGSEGNNLVIKGILPYLDKRSRRCIVTSAVEHDSVLRAVESCTKHGFYSQSVLPDKHGRISPGAVGEQLSLETGFASIMYVNNETGAVNEVEKIGELCHEQNVLFHTDCVQAAGCLPLDPALLNCDFLTVSSHKIHGPKGVGAVFAADPSLLDPLISGGSHQEFGLRGGTENVAGIVGFGKACQIANDRLEMYIRTFRRLHGVFYDAVRREFSACGLEDKVVDTVPLFVSRQAAKVLSLRFLGVDAQSMLLALDALGVCCSAGSACTSMENEPSHVLKAMGITDDDARSTLRFSFSDFNTDQDLLDAARKICEAYRTVSGLTKGGE